MSRPAAARPGPRDPEAADIAGLLAGFADPDSELVPGQVSALFAVALAGEPPSTVTAESVLREVRASEAARPVRFLSAEWFAEHASAWKWSGGLVAAAAVAGAFAVTVPGMGGSSTDSAMSVPASAEAQADSALSAAAEKAAGAGARAESDAAADGSQQAAPDASAMAEMDSAEAPAEGNMSVESASGLSAESGDTAGGSSGDAGAAQTSEGYSGAADASTGAVFPALTDAEWSAAVSALPQGVAATRPDQVLREKGLPVFGADVHMDRVGLGEVDTFIEVVVGPDSGPGTDYPGPSDDQDTVGNIGERLRHSGYVTAEAADGSIRVVVAAPEQTLRGLPDLDLDRMARAVLAAAG